MKYDIFKDKNAFITGASGGLGAALAFQLAESGCNLYLTGRSEKKLKALCDHIHESYPATQVKYFIADLSKILGFLTLISVLMLMLRPPSLCQESSFMI